MNNLEETKAQAYHSIALYAMLAGAPRLLKFPDAIDSALSGDKDLLQKDLQSLMLDCVFDIPHVLYMVLDTLGNYNKFKKECNEKLKEISELDDKLEAKNRCIEIINEILKKMGQPPVSKLLKEYGVKND